MWALNANQSGDREAAGARDDFYGHVNGGWLKATEIPVDQRAWGTLPELEEKTQSQLQGIIERIGSRPSDRTEAKIAALYASFMNEAQAEVLGVGPISVEWHRIDAINDKKQIPALIAHFNQINVEAPYALKIHQDARDPTRYIVDVRQNGLGLPSREYYSATDAELERVRALYQAHIETMMSTAGVTDAAAEAAAVLELESQLARLQWTPTENSDPIKTYNKYLLADLPKLTGLFDWQSYLTAAGIDGKVKFLIISQPSYMAGFTQLVEGIPLGVWKSYFKWRVLSASAPYLNKALVDANFAFYGTGLRGIPANRSRSRRGVTLINELIGEGLGKLYVKQYAQPTAKDGVDAMVQIVLAAFRTRIGSLDWMGSAAQKAARKKLDHLVLKTGSPTQFRVYDKFEVRDDDLLGNVVRGAEFEFSRNIAKLGAPIDRDEWHTLPQSVTAYYDPQLNEIVLPAALFQPPLYEMDVDDAVNYGGIGTLISQEISRSFDQVGAQYRADGKLFAWLNGPERDKLEAKSRALVAQYDAFEPATGGPVFGRMFGESIADNAGIAMAHLAYRLALAGKEPPMKDGLTGDQRFFASFAHIERFKSRAEEAVTDPMPHHRSAAAARIDSTLVNQPSFSVAFGLERGDGMYLAPSQRVNLW